MLGFADRRRLRALVQITAGKCQERIAVDADVVQGLLLLPESFKSRS